MHHANTKTTIQKIRETIATFGLCKTIVSDNGTQFKSLAFQNFCKHNRINRMNLPPYHPSSNGAAENAVKSFKSAKLLKILKMPIFH